MKRKRYFQFVRPRAPPIEKRTKWTQLNQPSLAETKSSFHIFNPIGLSCSSESLPIGKTVASDNVSSLLYHRYVIVCHTTSTISPLSINRLLLKIAGFPGKTVVQWILFCPPLLVNKPTLTSSWHPPASTFSNFKFNPIAQSSIAIKFVSSERVGGLGLGWWWKS